MSEDRHLDAIVVGMGPVGCSMALALAREGLSILIVDQFLVPFNKPRAIGIDHESLRLLQALGIMEEFGPTLGEYRPSEYRAADGSMLRRIVPQSEPFPLSWPPYATFVQPELERILRAACEAHPSIEMVFGHRASEFQELSDCVSLSLGKVDAETGLHSSDAEHVQCSFLVGCDGARSAVRESLSVGSIDLDFDEQWLVVDVIVKDGIDLPKVTVQYCNAVRPATYIEGPGALRRWEIMLLPGEDGSEMAAPERVWELLAPWISQGEGELWRAAAYRFHAVVAERWQNGRMFIAGDAAHQTPPFMAQGLNQGFRDVVNLAWKIGQVHKYGAPPSILESYSEERQPNAMAAIEVTKALGKIICELDPERAAERNRAMLAEVDAGKGEFIRQDLLPPLKPGSLIAPHERFSKGAGEAFPQPVIGQGSQTARMDDVVAGRFVLFVDGSTALTAAVVECAKQAGVEIVQFGQKSITGVTVLNELNGVGSAWLETHSVIAALARPDHIVFGTAKEVEACENLIALLLRALSLRHV